MTSTLVACGGTGAHVALAFIRLHALGHALGFFYDGKKPVGLPAVFLVDQDAGDGIDEPTAWQLVRRLVDRHPAAPDPAPDLERVTPLPIGPKRDWFNEPNHKLGRRFAGSEYLSALTGEPQREIDYSRGMMGSPAVGSLLLDLKQNDRDRKGNNHDQVYDRLCGRKGRIAVVGSGVGGTGASVGPRLALGAC